MSKDRMADAYHNGSVARYFLLVATSVPLVLTAPVVTSSFVEDETWSIGTAIGTLWFGVALALALFEKLRATRTKAEYSLRFPGFRGNHFQIFHLLKYEDNAGLVEFNDPDLVYSLGEADESLFFFKNKRTKAGETLPLGKLVTSPARGNPLVLRLDEITEVTVIERSDKEIAGSAVDPRDFAERFGSQIAERLTGTSMKTTIIPYAAYVAITADTATEQKFVLFAIPTTVTAGALKAMKERITDTDFETPWLVSAAVDKAKSMLVNEIEDNMAGAVGKWTNDTVGGGVQMANDAADVVGEAMTWLNPNAAAIATTAGDNGRSMARLIAMRISHRTGRIPVG